MTKREASDLTIIGIGSSAGGLEAVRELVANLPSKLPVSYVVVQHMSPHHKSLMTELVARETNLNVADVTDGVEPAANVIYITPPKTDVVFSDGKLRLVAPSKEPASPKPSVDRFLLSLADDHGEKSIALILSGTGSDGAYGVQAIREAGGITIAQAPETAKYDGMPQSAIQTGCIDLVLRPMDVGTHLNKILLSARDFSSFQRGDSTGSPISDLLQILLARTRVDFREYKRTTINRRIERRMVALGLETQEEYTRFCRNNPAAVDDLFRDLLISVTRFFRDSEEFKRLRSLLPQLIANRGDAPLRVWIAGCATGEEAYSIAMLLADAMDLRDETFKSAVQIFATDIDKNALKVARQGVYGAAVLNDIPEELAAKYLIRQGDTVRVIDSLRSAILFSDHNVCKDPPFQKIDLLCCRNLLIYFGNALQQKIMSRFHYSMSPNAVMFLGTAESVGGSDELFIPNRTASHIYHKRTLIDGTDQAYNMPNIPSYSRRPSTAVPHKQSRAPSTDRQLFEALAQSLGQNSILVTEDYSIARVYGSVSSFIEVNETTNLKMHLDLLRSPLREEARSLVTIALKNHAHRAGVRHLLAETDEDEIRLDVYPIIAKDITERAALVVFTPVKKDVSKTARRSREDNDDAAVTERIINLENEVATAREALQQTIKELETSNEELQSLNEELQSTNEEMQATNEELETSNEELQSTNEELITVNEELQVTAAELSGRTGELASVLQSTPLAIMVTDCALQVKQATPAATEKFKIKYPIGSPHISQAVLPNGYPALAPICSKALTMGETVTVEFSSLGAQVAITCSPYFDTHGQILGLTMVVTEFPGLAREMEQILDSPNMLIMNRASDGTILRISEAAARGIGMTREEAIGKNLYDFLTPDIAKIAKEDDLAALKSDTSHSSVLRHTKSMNTDLERWISVNRFRYQTAPDSDPSVYSIGVDVTPTVVAQKRADDLLEQVMVIQDLAGIGYWSVDVQTQEVIWSERVFEIHRLDPSEGTPHYDDALAFYHPEDVKALEAALARAQKEQSEFIFDGRLVCKNDEIVPVEVHGIVRKDDAGNVCSIVGIIQEKA